jgi:hypothetical protein
MLGQLRMTVDEYIEEYVWMSDRIFQYMIKGQIRRQFSLDELKLTTKEIVII